MNINLEEILQVVRHETPERLLEEATEYLVTLVGADAGVILVTDDDRVTEVQAGSLAADAQAQFEDWKQANHAPPTTITSTTHGNLHLVLLPFGRAASTDDHVIFIFQDQSRMPDDSVIERTHAVTVLVAEIFTLRRDLAVARTTQQRLEHLSKVGKSLASTLDLNELLYETIQLAAEAVDAEAASVIILDPDTDELVFQIAHGAKREQLREVRLATTEGIAGWVFRHGEPTIVNDPTNDPRFAEQVDRQTGFRTRNILCTPLQIKGMTIGVLQVLNKHNEAGFDQEDVELLLPVAGEAAVALENARLYQDLREERDRIIEAQEEVRREIARNLHDGTVQMLSSIIMSLSHARRLIGNKPDMLEEELEYLETLAQRALRETRMLLFELRPVVLETRGLAAALESYVKRLNRSDAGAPVILTLDSDLPDLPGTVARTLFALIQEAVNNARKHADSETIDVDLEVHDDHLEVTISDDGCGFDLEAVQEQYDDSGSLGLLNMRERAELIDAVLNIDCAPGEGTSVLVQLPLGAVSSTNELTNVGASR